MSQNTAASALGGLGKFTELRQRLMFVVLALIVVPYFDINLQRRPLWEPSVSRASRQRKLAGIVAVVAALSIIFLFTGNSTNNFTIN